MERAGLADLLRELKERSGRSYGALAKQMHMSTSTLHRYCNGDAVPTEFAPVERLARLCGADREELLRLHRSWIVADEARRRAKAAASAATGGAAAPPVGTVTAPAAVPGRGSAPVPEAGAEPEAEPGAEPVPEPGSGPHAASGTDPRPTATTGPTAEAAPGPEAASGPEAAPGPEAASGPPPASARVAGPRPEGAPAPVAAPEPTPAPRASGVPLAEGERAPAGGSPAGERRADGTATGPEAEARAGRQADAAPPERPDHPAGRRRRVRLLAAVAGTAVLAVSGAAVALTHRSLPSPAGPDVPAVVEESAAPSAQTRPGSGPTTPVRPATSPPAAATSAPVGGAAPARTAPVGPGGAAGSDGGGAAPGGAGVRQVPAVPLTADVDPYVWKDPCSQVYVVDRPPTRMPPPPSELEARGWVTALGGTPGGEMVIDVSLQGVGDETVVLKALHVRAVETSQPLPGNAYVMGVGCGGEARLQGHDVNLDAARPRPVPVAGYQGDRLVPASDFPYTVSRDDPQVLRITAHTSARHVRWYLELEWTSGGRSGTLRLDDRGRPFSTSAARGVPTYQFPLGADGWGPFVAG
ncbi:helix-turn-helix domain-containing protein [Streptomyces kanasensis]|uniref:helix-turn-helix domain-containing protein n=1 Tax=Streptomyces kanasensis TaxID=936756 RepID=UPI003824A4FC